MTLKEWLIQNHSTHCYHASNITEPTHRNGDEKSTDVKVAEVWQIPLVLLNKEIEVK